jgi:sterol 3beta-glucosyltransferase
MSILPHTMYAVMQPFIAIGRKLQAAGHRVRLATHATMRALVERHALEFYPLGGDPRVLGEFAAESRGATAH